MFCVGQIKIKDLDRAHNAAPRVPPHLRWCRFSHRRLKFNLRSGGGYCPRFTCANNYEQSKKIQLSRRGGVVGGYCVSRAKIITNNLWKYYFHAEAGWPIDIFYFYSSKQTEYKMSGSQKKILMKAGWPIDQFCQLLLTTTLQKSQ